MTNRQFAEMLVSKIEHHKHKLCDGKNDPVTAAYAQAHNHIIELINVLKPDEDELTAFIPAHWISKKIDKSHYHYFCSHCYYESRFVKSPFCPGCGYRMVEVQQTLDNADDL